MRRNPGRHRQRHQCHLSRPPPLLRRLQSRPSDLHACLMARLTAPFSFQQSPDALVLTSANLLILM